MASGCSSEDVSTEIPATPMLINATTETRMDGNNTETPVFLFWKASELISNNYNLTNQSPYCVSKPTAGIDTYKEKQWDTGYNYPENNLSVLATGYFPQTLNTEDNYQTMTIPVPGKTDVMVAQKMVEGSSLSPYTFQEDHSSSLQFVHTQTLLIFKAIRHATMKKFVRNVKITMAQEHLPYQLVWRADGLNSCYQVSSKADPQNPYSIKGASDQLSAQDEATDQRSLIGSIFIKPLSESITITVESEMSNNQGFSSSAITSIETTIDLTNIPKEENSEEKALLQAGDKYEITLVFQEDKIELVGRKLPWEEGGNILIPVYPLSQNSSTGEPST